MIRLLKDETILMPLPETEVRATNQAMHPSTRSGVSYVVALFARAV